jgi:hypothetical protein
MTLGSFIGEMIYIMLFAFILACGIPLWYEIMCCAGNFAADVLQCFIERLKSWIKLK